MVNDGPGDLPPADETATPSRITEPVKVVCVGSDERLAGVVAGLSVPAEFTMVNTAVDVDLKAGVVLVDFDSLGTSGWDQLIDVIKRFERSRAAVAVVTSSPNRPDWERAHHLGAWGYL